MNFLEPFTQMLRAVFAPDAVRAVEGGESTAGMWQAVCESGFLDALVAEEHGGAGLHMTDVGPLWQALGYHMVPLPVADTMVARQILAAAGVDAPSGPIALATIGTSGEGLVSFGRTASHVLVHTGDALVLVDGERGGLDESGVFGDLDAKLTLDGTLSPLRIRPPADGLRPAAALIRAALIAGAGARLLEMTVAYANERIQFGKPIGRQQALQQNLAVMAEDVVATRIAVELGCASGSPPSLRAAAIAKSMASAAAPRIATTAHAVHGAIGISEEHDLQLFTRALHGWRLAEGSEKFWNYHIGALRLPDPANSVDWARSVAA